MRGFLLIVLALSQITSRTGFAESNLYEPVQFPIKVVSAPVAASQSPIIFDYDEVKSTAKLFGHLQPADRDIQKWIRETNNILNIVEKNNIKTIYLNSIGGDAFLALLLSEIVREKKLKTIVPREGVCFSACVWILMAGREKLAYGKVGVHRVSIRDHLSEAGNESEYLLYIGGKLGATDVADAWHPALRYFREVTPCDQIALLTEVQKVAFGLLPRSDSKKWAEDQDLPEKILPYKVMPRLTIDICDENGNRVLTEIPSNNEHSREHSNR